jgi:D-beta-D-heptose 7-phosphate kinase/D-beta-D-heptose 1-phosphate adenosyltransferase
MAFVEAGRPGQVFATRPRDVYDVTGAGDMVLAVVGLCRAAGVLWEETIQLANAAAGLEVERLGVEPITRAEVRADLIAGVGAASKRVSGEEMAVLAEGYRTAGRRVVFTNGCFDLLHAGHVQHLQEAARLGDVLVVALNSDESVRRLKGADRPIIPQADRAALLAALACVDHVLVFDEDTPHRLLRLIRPDVLVKGGDYSAAAVIGREVVESYGGTVCVTGRVEGVSTTHLLASLRGQAQAG